jgi:uncharacterized membrane protein
MHRRRFIGTSGALALAVAGLPRRIARAQAAYSAVDLGVPEGFDAATPIAVNNNGVAVLSATKGETSGIFIVENGSFTQVGEKDEVAHATSIDDANTVGGWVEGASDGSGPAPDVPALLTAGGQVEMPGDRLDGRVYALLQDGRAVGEAAIDASRSARKAVIWDSQEVNPLKGIPKDGASAALDLNALGQIAGWIESTENGVTTRTAVLMSVESDPVPLGDIGRSISEAVAISQQGLVVGNSVPVASDAVLYGNGTAAFSWTDGTVTQLQTLDGQAWSRANDVNSFGLVAGTVGLGAPATASAATMAVVWAPDALLDLNQVTDGLAGLTLVSAVSINELGQILCGAVDAGGVSRAVLLSIIGN